MADDLTPPHWKGKPFKDVADEVFEERKKAKCEHEYKRSPYSFGGFVIVYECVKCGDEYEKDVS